MKMLPTVQNICVTLFIVWALTMTVTGSLLEPEYRYSVQSDTESWDWNEDANLFEGDIRRMPNDPSDGFASSNTTKLWKDGKLAYVFDDSITSHDKQSVLAALNDLMRRTCLQFHQRTDEPDFIRFKNKGKNCWSYVGRQGGDQVINLGSGCLSKMGTIQHQVMHALGFWHEHSRSDRDNFVDIIWDNIKPGAERNFDKHHTDNFSLPYDYDSVMHYSWNAFAKTKLLPTIKPKKASGRDPQSLGQQEVASATDIEKIRRLYGCSNKVRPKTPIKWNINSWAFKCDFPNSPNLKVVSTECSRCGPICRSEKACTHFTCKLRQCTLKTGDVTTSDATPTTYASVCGITREGSVDETTETKSSIEWNEENWAFGCNFPETANITTRTLSCSRCRSACLKNDACTHFTCAGNQCTLKRDPVSKAFAEVSPDTWVCGVAREAVISFSPYGDD